MLNGWQQTHFHLSKPFFFLPPLQIIGPGFVWHALHACFRTRIMYCVCVFSLPVYYPLVDCFIVWYPFLCFCAVRWILLCSFSWGEWYFFFIMSSAVYWFATGRWARFLLHALEEFCQIPKQVMLCSCRQLQSQKKKVKLVKECVSQHFSADDLFWKLSWSRNRASMLLGEKKY